ncbi:uncharacterized protein [Macrobrachium rosenbergii]|uniref:uncharacterized protein n=1 Tax=Macrobrachium rosenbergii TaxID=79674 RepID=UPI0034D4370E
MASPGPIFSPEALRSFRYHYFVTQWGKKVLFIVYENCFILGQAKGIIEILFTKGVLLSKKGNINKKDLENLAYKPPEDLDITLMHKICYQLWQKGFNDPGDELKELVKKIKDERNAVSHEVQNMSYTDLDKKLKGFQATLEETLDKTKFLFPVLGVRTDQLKAEIRAAVPELLGKIHEKYDPSDQKDVEKLKQEIKEFWSELSEEVQKSSREEFLSLYSRLCQILPFDWLVQHGITDPCNIIIYLQVQDDSRFNESRRGREGPTVDQRCILRIRNARREDPEVVIISGDAGSGKTTILCSFVEKWFKNTVDIPELSSFDTLLYMQFRDLKYDNFADYLKGLLPHTIARYDFTNVQSHILGSKCLIFCDGYDEANENSKKLFEEMLQLNWKDKKIVVTTRPGNTEELTNDVNSTKRTKINLKVLGLQENDFNLLTEKLTGYLVKDSIQQEKLRAELSQKVREMNYTTKAILRTPLLFNMFILLYVECPELRNELSTRASLYLQLKKNMAKRILKKTKISEESLEEFDELYRKWSLRHYIEKKYEWSEGDMKSFKREISSKKVLENFRSIMSSYFIIKHARDHLNIVKVFCYSHRSEQEFAIARNICEDLMSGRRQQGETTLLKVLQSKGLANTSMSDIQIFRQLRDLIAFIPGILQQEYPKSDALYNHIKDVQKLYVAYSLSQRMHDDLLEPCMETRLDDQVVQSLASLLEGTPLKECSKYKNPDSCLVLPSLVSKLKPARIDLEETPRDLSKVEEILQVAIPLDVYTTARVWIDLDNVKPFTGKVSLPVDELRVFITNFDPNRDEELEVTYPYALMSIAKEMKLIYDMPELDTERSAYVVNRSYPRDRRDTDLSHVFIKSSTDCELFDLLQRLVAARLAPLTSVGIYARRENVVDEELQDYCYKNGLGDLFIC